MARYQIQTIDTIQGRPCRTFYRVGVYRCHAYPEAVLLREYLNNLTDDQKDAAYTVMMEEMKQHDAA